MHQFVHLNAYGVKVSKNKRSASRPLDDIFSEMLRRPGYHRHIKEPAAPKILHGDPEAEWRRIKREQVTQTYPDGRNLRCDGIVALVGIISYPKLRVSIQQDEREMADVVRWAQQSVTWTRRVWRQSLRCAVLHLDEDFLHLHFLVSPDELCRTLELHPGHAAKKRAVAKGLTAPAPNDAYKRAMTKFQDSYHVEVASQFGFSRISDAPRGRHYETREVRQMKRMGLWIPGVGPVVQPTAAKRGEPEAAQA